MTNDEKTQWNASISADKTGKVFAPIGVNMFLCLICECVFTRQSSREHASVPCRVAFANVADYSAQYPICVSYVPTLGK